MPSPPMIKHGLRENAPFLDHFPVADSKHTVTFRGFPGGKMSDYRRGFDSAGGGHRGYIKSFLRNIEAFFRVYVIHSIQLDIYTH